MENRINITELLKDCPKGMELDCTIWDNVVFDHIVMKSDYPIHIKKMGGEEDYLTEEGCFNFDLGAKCVIFPKGKTTWEGFVPPCKFKDGEVVINASNKNSNAFIYAGEDDDYYKSYVGLTISPNSKLSTDKSTAWVSKESGIRLATEEEQAKLFQVIKDKGYKWNAETKTLEKLPKFKVGDRVRNKNYKDYIYDIQDIIDKGYKAKEINTNSPILILFGSQEYHYELAPNKFDITTLKPFDKVLVRGDVGQKWTHDFFGFMDKDKGYPFVCVGHYVIQCIPYDKNEHLLGTKDDCDNYYKTWK